MYLTKGKSETLSLFSKKKSNINIVQNFEHVQNKSLIYRPAIHNLQTRTVSFLDHKNLLEKVDGDGGG